MVRWKVRVQEGCLVSSWMAELDFVLCAFVLSVLYTGGRREILKENVKFGFAGFLFSVLIPSMGGPCVSLSVEFLS